MMDMGNMTCTNMDGTLMDDLPFCGGCTTDMDGNISQSTTNMYMSGFQFNSYDVSCIMLWFPGWTLNTPAKFIIGCIGVALIGIAIQFIIRLRLSPYLKSPRYIQNKPLRESAGVFLYALNMFLAYFLMLAFMTYNVEIFASAMTGIVVGHIITVVLDGQDASAGTTFCCQEMELKNEASQSKLATGSLPAQPKSGHVRSDICVEGMTCQSCSKTVKETLVSLATVSAAQVSLQDMMVVVDHTPDVSADSLKKAIIASGYDAEVLVNGVQNVV